MCVRVCVAYKYGVFDCHSPSDTLSCAVFSYDLRTYRRPCCVSICTMDSHVACGGGSTGSCTRICEVRVMVVPSESYISVSSVLAGAN